MKSPLRRCSMSALEVERREVLGDPMLGEHCDGGKLGVHEELIGFDFGFYRHEME